jgi:hypothetical protein
MEALRISSIATAAESFVNYFNCCLTSFIDPSFKSKPN